MLVVEPLSDKSVTEAGLEVVERKGLGHPDTICDALAEEFSRALCRFYLEKFGFILHHNVDKGLLFAGSAEPEFGGGKILEPFELYFVGRATLAYKDVSVPVKDLAHEIIDSWFNQHFHVLHPQQHVKTKVLVRPGSLELVELFRKFQKTGVPLANDTSVGVGYAPLSPLEKLVLHVEKFLNAPSFREKYPAVGQDIKVMGVREDSHFKLTIACATIGRYLKNLDDYLSLKRNLLQELKTKFSQDYPSLEIHVNTADDIEKGDIYLTVTGTSAEAGDDGEVGRGNRVNGLITPFRPMSLEAAAGKNPVSHVGKIYNLLTNEIAETLVSEIPEIKEAYVTLVSRIGSPITEPQTLSLKIKTEGDFEKISSNAKEIAYEELQKAPKIWQKIISGELACY
ncbi:methionine adenosyltransferase [Thermodesulfatator atlanticus]|uniref:methionine adenosyltransferase n=1 Tax=Thermodesulfatator atlanticus TaxID=501497 RepID=UPI0003B594E8|nr:methionine adenosyltransferase [Thermodesulfatator atlanticus]